MLEVGWYLRTLTEMPAMFKPFLIALSACSCVVKLTTIDPALWFLRLSADVSQYGVPMVVYPLLKVEISSRIRAMPSSLLKSLVGMP